MENGRIAIRANSVTRLVDKRRDMKRLLQVMPEMGDSNAATLYSRGQLNAFTSEEKRRTLPSRHGNAAKVYLEYLLAPLTREGDVTACSSSANVQGRSSTRLRLN